MAKYWTWAEISAKVKLELDLQGEIFIDPAELLEYCNEGIDDAESQIHSLYEDYFLTYSTVSLVSGTSEYTLPTSIYAHKIRKVVFRNGQNVFEVKRIRNKDKIVGYSLNRATTNTAPYYEYLLINSTAGSPKIIFTPNVTDTGDYIEVWYIRNANRLSVDADVCDIPEFVKYVMQYMKVRVYEKEIHPNLLIAKQELEVLKQDMVSTLAAMISDDDNEIEADYTMYDQMS